MKYKIINEENTNYWYRNDNITIIPIRDFNILIDNDITNILKNILKEDEFLKFLKCNANILNNIIDIIINDKKSNDIINILNDYNVPYFSFYICIINTYKTRYKYLKELYSSQDTIISYNIDNIDKAIQLAKYLKGNKILDNTHINLLKYKDIIEKYLKEDITRKDITFYYQENNKPITPLELLNTSQTVNNIINEVTDTNLSPIESIMYVYDKLKGRIYKLDEEDYHNSSDVSQVLSGDAIVCSGYSNLFNAILRCINIPSIPLISIEANHQRSITYIKDTKYNIDGVYIFDPTWDRKKDKDDTSYINKYNYFAIPLSLSNNTAKVDLYKTINLTFEDIINCNENITDEESIKTIEDIDNIFELVINKSFTDIITNANYFSSSEVMSKVNQIYSYVISKIAKDNISIETFTKIIYNTRKVQYKNKIITSLNINEIKLAIRDRYEKIKLNEIKNNSLNQSKKEIQFKLLIYQIKLNALLDKYINEILFKEIPLNKNINKKTLKKSNNLPLTSKKK